MTIFGIRISRTSTIEREITNAVEEHKWESLTNAHHLFIKEGYREWVNTPPPRDRQFLMIRAGWYFPELTSQGEVSPYMNTVGAFWKLEENKEVEELERLYSRTPEGDK